MADDKVQIYTARIQKVRQTLPTPPEHNVLNLNCLNFFPNNKFYHPLVGNIQLDEISPYVLKDAAGHIMENIWQFQKCSERVTAQHEVKAGKVIWSHPAEVHIANGQYTEAFWAWRKKGWENPYPVRYPNGFHGRTKCLHSLWWDGNKWLQMGYVQSRKVVYCNVYEQLVTKTTAFAQLQKLLQTGHKLQICEVDVRSGPVTREVLLREIENTKQAFGHGYVLSACLLGHTDIWK